MGHHSPLAVINGSSLYAQVKESSVVCYFLHVHRSQRAFLSGITFPNIVGVVRRNHESLPSCLHRALIRDGDVYDSDVYTHTNVGSMLQSKECKV